MVNLTKHPGAFHHLKILYFVCSGKCRPVPPATLGICWLQQAQLAIPSTEVPSTGLSSSPLIPVLFSTKSWLKGVCCLKSHTGSQRLSLTPSIAIIISLRLPGLHLPHTFPAAG